MLAQALAVVEAARSLRPVEAPAIPGMWRLQCEPRRMAEAIRQLGETLAEFDATTGSDHDPLALVARAVRYAQSQGIPADEMVAAIRGGSESNDDLREASSVADLKPQPGEIGRPDAVSDGSPVQEMRPAGPRPGVKAEIAAKYKPAEPTKMIRALEPVSRPSVPVAVPIITGETAGGTKVAETVDHSLDHEYSVALADAGETAADIGLEMDAISDRLEAVVGRVGWTPKLRALAAAWYNARNKIAGANLSNTAGFKIDIADALIMTKVSTELAQLEATPDLEPTAEEQWAPPTPRFTR